jgi:hypothetical protein
LNSPHQSSWFTEHKVIQSLIKYFSGCESELTQAIIENRKGEQNENIHAFAEAISNASGTLLMSPHLPLHFTLTDNVLVALEMQSGVTEKTLSHVCAQLKVKVSNKANNFCNPKGSSNTNMSYDMLYCLDFCVNNLESYWLLFLWLVGWLVGLVF